MHSRTTAAVRARRAKEDGVCDAPTAWHQKPETSWKLKTQGNLDLGLELQAKEQLIFVVVVL